MNISLRWWCALSMLVVFSSGPGRADNANSTPEGILILNRVAGHEAANVVFTDIQWTNTYGGYATGVDGNKTSFTNDALGRIIYFDRGYYDQVDHFPNWINWRAGLQSLEVIAPPLNTMTITASDLPRLQTEETDLDAIAQHFTSAAPVLTPLLGPFKEAVAKLQSGQVLHDGKWMKQEEANAIAPTPVNSSTGNGITFTTKDGRKFENAMVTVTDTGLSVLTPEGGANIPLNQLPADLSVFPESVRAQLDKQFHVAGAEPPKPPVETPAPTASSSFDPMALLSGWWNDLNKFLQQQGDQKYYWIGGGVVVVALLFGLAGRMFGGRR